MFARRDEMSSYSIDADLIHSQSKIAGKRSSAGEGPALAAQLRGGERLSGEDLATLFHATDVTTDELLKIASGARGATEAVETFSPLYLTNECDGECKMCGMRRFNDDLRRETADEGTSRGQLEVLHKRGMRGVALLTGEYRKGATRTEMMGKTRVALSDALEKGFEHVLINIGSLDEPDYDTLFADVPRRDDGKFAPHITMCTFQETYDPAVYGRFMGTNEGNPRADYQRRLANFDRAKAAGMRSANPGVLLGLNKDVSFEIIALAGHVEHLIKNGMRVYISLPRLRKASGAEHMAGVTDDELVRVVSVLTAGFPEADVVISTREAPPIQQRLLPAIGVLTAGSPGVAPYDASGARFELEASQFEVDDQRPFEVILDECIAGGTPISGYESVQAPSEQAG
jgi:2-iminoacetate synthase